jgi:hypothetical protein
MGVDIEGAELGEVGTDAALVFQLSEFELNVGGFSGVVVFGTDCSRIVCPGVRIAQFSVSV